MAFTIAIMRLRSRRLLDCPLFSSLSVDLPLGLCSKPAGYYYAVFDRMLTF